MSKGHIVPPEDFGRDRRFYIGPTNESNWLIPDHVMVGAYPADIDTDVTNEQLSKMLLDGITTFVCLQAEYDPDVREEEWTSGLKLRPYMNDVGTLLTTHKIDFTKSSKGKPKKVDFIHFPIVDCRASASDEQILYLCVELVHRIINGECLYIHCWGGHGRAGTVASILLGLAYGYNSTQAMEVVQKMHDHRISPLGVPSPQTNEQRDQVVRVLSSPEAALYVDGFKKFRPKSSRTAAEPDDSAVSVGGSAELELMKFNTVDYTSDSGMMPVVRARGTGEVSTLATKRAGATDESTEATQTPLEGGSSPSHSLTASDSTPIGARGGPIKPVATAIASSPRAGFGTRAVAPAGAGGRRPGPKASPRAQSRNELNRSLRASDTGVTMIDMATGGTEGDAAAAGAVTGPKAPEGPAGKRSPRVSVAAPRSAVTTAAKAEAPSEGVGAASPSPVAPSDIVSPAESPLGKRLVVEMSSDKTAELMKAATTGDAGLVGFTSAPVAAIAVARPPREKPVALHNRDGLNRSARASDGSAVGISNLMAIASAMGTEGTSASMSKSLGPSAAAAAAKKR